MTADVLIATIMFGLGLVLAIVGLVVAFRHGTLATYIAGFVFFRFHLFAAAFLMAFPSLAFRSSLLRGLMIIDSGRAIVVVTGVAFVAAWVILGATVITFVYGPRQFGTEMPQPPIWVRGWRLPLASLVVIPILFSVLEHSNAERWVKVGSAVLGFGFACVVLRIGKWLFDQLTPTRLREF